MIEADRRFYTSAAIDVSFDAGVCCHSGRCVTGLPTVFDLGRRPWIQPDNADPVVVAAQVSQCPSGALRSHVHRREA